MANDSHFTGAPPNEKKQSPWGITTPAPLKFFDNQLINYKEAAQYLGVSESYLRRLKSKGSISFVQIGTRGIRFRVCSLNKWIEEREC